MGGVERILEGVLKRPILGGTRRKVIPVHGYTGELYFTRCDTPSEFWVAAFIDALQNAHERNEQPAVHPLPERTRRPGHDILSLPYATWPSLVLKLVSKLDNAPQRPYAGRAAEDDLLSMR